MTATRVTLDFSSLIAERTQHFSGRGWVFERINQWLADPKGGRVFLLAGGPGTGKTAIAARLAQASEGSVNLPACDRLQRGFLTYMHFCQAGSDSTLTPINFVQGLSEALANAFPAFRAALEQQGSDQVVLNPVVNTGAVASGGKVTGLIYNVKKVEIQINGDDARSMFDVAVRSPLYVHAQAHPDQGAVVLIDSLDEALTFSRERSIAHLLQLVNDFPPNVRFILTARSNNPRITALVGEPHLDLIKDAKVATGGVDEVKTYAEIRLAGVAEERREKLAATIAAKSQGNFLFAYHVLNQIVASPESDAALDDIPDALEGVYRAFLKRELDAAGELWSARFRPLLGTIAVARDGTLSKTHLAGITGLTPAAIDDVLRICREYLVAGDSASGLRLYHYSFQEFLLTDPDYNVYPAERHQAIAAHFLGVHGKSWRKCQDLYALRYTPFHLSEAARGLDQSRESLIRTLVELTENAHFQAQCVELLRDLPLLEDHFTRALATAALSDRDEMLPWIARSSQSMAAFRHKFLTSESVLAPARAGDIVAAEGRLAMFTGLDRDWRVAASLIIAWLAHDAKPSESRQAVDALTPNATADPLPLLVERIRAAQIGAATYAAEELPAETPAVGVALVRRLSGQSVDRELLNARGMNVLLSDQTELIEAGGYAATLDGPILVNSARVYGDAATANVDAYVDAHAGYNYVEYRNRSLWVLLKAVLRHHPQQQWVRDRLARVLGAALTAGGADFTEMAPLAATALRERSAGSAAPPIVDAVLGAARGAIATLRLERGANDSWSLHRRRLTMLMELEALVRSNAAASAAIGEEIQELERARVLEGFAGFRAPAELRLADAMRLCGQPMPAVLDRVMTAVRTAHHIQDYHFCSRITARCNTLMRWHRADLPPASLAATIERFVAAPGDVDFAAEHVVGEAFQFRGRGEMAAGAYRSPEFPIVRDDQMLPIWQASQADSLDRLADVFQRPVLEFVRLNPTIGLRTTIGPMVTVHVPDPGLAPLLASHFSARVLAETSLGLERAGLIRSLLPVALANATAFDTVFAYLLIASDPEDGSVLDRIVAQFGNPVPPPAGPSPQLPRGIPA